MKSEFAARMIRIHFGEDDRWQGHPLHEAILAQCRALEIAEVIVFRGIEGYGSASRIRTDSPWRLSKDAPIQITVIDTPEKIARLLPQLDTLVEEGLVVSSEVQAIRFSRHP